MAEPLTKRIALLPWEQLQHSLDEQGFAVLPPVLQPEECQELIATYREDRFFRATINMARYRFGSGEYRYYQAPLPPIVEQLREGFWRIAGTHCSDSSLPTLRRCPPFSPVATSTGRPARRLCS